MEILIPSIKIAPIASEDRPLLSQSLSLSAEIKQESPMWMKGEFQITRLRASTSILVKWTKSMPSRADIKPQSLERKALLPEGEDEGII